MERPSPLRRLRLASGLTLRDVERRAGVSKTYLADIERGLHRAGPDALRAILAAIRAQGPPDPDAELARDLATPFEVVEAELDSVKAAVEEAIARLEDCAEDDRAPLREFCAHALRRVGAIVASLKVRSARPS